MYVPYTRVTWSGTIGPAATPVEEFSFGVSIEADGDWVTQSVVDAYWNAGAALFGDPASKICTAARLKQVKASVLDASGHLVGNAVLKTGDVPGASNSSPHPPQVAWAVSLGTGVRGPSRRGRFYLPLPTCALNNAGDLTVDTTTRDGAEAAVVTFLRAVKAAQAGSQIVVASNRGYNTNVTTVRLGRSLDTLRTRRRSMPELYDAGTVL